MCQADGDTFLFNNKVGSFMIEANSKAATTNRNLQQNMNDVITILPNLLVGLDVNVQFNHVEDFEFTPECATFDMVVSVSVSVSVSVLVSVFVFVAVLVLVLGLVLV
jgi:hypothetical protein